jgi:hypothetical protein
MKQILVITGALVLAGGFAGCGSSGGGGGSDSKAWVGSWRNGGTQTTTCGAVTVMTGVADPMVVISAGSKAGTIQTASGGCTLTWDVSGDAATLESGQSCTASINGQSDTVTWTAGSATLSGTAITGTSSGSASNGCSFDLAYALSRS